MPNNTKKEERCAGCGKCTERATTSEQCLKMGDCPCHWSIPSPQSPLSEEKERIIDWCKKRMEHNKIQYGTDKWNGDMEDLVELLSGKE